MELPSQPFKITHESKINITKISIYQWRPKLRPTIDNSLFIDVLNKRLINKMKQKDYKITIKTYGW